jgi:hypothetical protein
VALKKAGCAGLRKNGRSGKVILEGKRTEEYGSGVILVGPRHEVGDGGAEITMGSWDSRVDA